jgi:site-specific recombinase XerD
LTEKRVQTLLLRAAQRAGLQNNGPHMLRHSFCSHLAMKGAPVRAIQELAGHKDLSTTQRYMHLSPSALVAAIHLLDQANCEKFRGDMVETGTRENHNINSSK